jgi:hypothetical protein
MARGRPLDHGAMETLYSAAGCGRFSPTPVLKWLLRPRRRFPSPTAHPSCCPQARQMRAVFEHFGKAKRVPRSHRYSSPSTWRMSVLLGVRQRYNDPSQSSPSLKTRRGSIKFPNSKSSLKRWVLALTRAAISIKSISYFTSFTPFETEKVRGVQGTDQRTWSWMLVARRDRSVGDLHSLCSRPVPIPFRYYPSFCFVGVFVVICWESAMGGAGGNRRSIDVRLIILGGICELERVKCADSYVMSCEFCLKSRM